MRIRFETGHLATVVVKVTNNILPVTDWVMQGETPPPEHERLCWNDGATVVGEDWTVEFSDGERLVGWVAEGDYRITFYDTTAAKKKIGQYGPIFMPANRVGAVSPGCVVFTDEFVQ